MLIEELRQEQVKIGYDSFTWLKNFSKNKDYQYHLKNFVDLIKITEMELSIYKNNLKCIYIIGDCNYEKN